MDTDPITPPVAQPTPAVPVDPPTHAVTPPSLPASPAQPTFATPAASAVAPEPHSGFGISSLIVAGVVGAGVFVLFVIAGILHNQGRGPHDPATALVGFGIMGLLAADIAALGLGIAGLCQRHRKKVTAILGVVLSGLILLGTLAIILLGLLLRRHYE